MMNKKIKKTLTLLLTFALVFGQLATAPHAVYAANGTATWNADISAIQTTINGWSDGNNVITVSGTPTGTLTIPAGVTGLTITGSSQTINGAIRFETRTGPLELTLENLTLNSNASHAVYLDSTCTLALTVNGNVSLKGRDGGPNHGLLVNGGGELTISGSGVLNATGGNSGSSGGGYGIVAAGGLSIGQSCTVNATGGNSTGTTGGRGISFEGTFNNAGTVTAIGGNSANNAGGDGYYGGYGLYTDNGSIINSGSITATGGNGGDATGSSGNGGAGGSGIWVGIGGSIINSSSGTIMATGGDGGTSVNGTGGAGGIGANRSSLATITNNAAASAFKATGGAGGMSTGGTHGAHGSPLNEPADNVDTSSLFTTQPQDRNITAGGNTTFSVTMPTGSYTYQWQVSTNSGTTWNNAIGGVYSNTTTDTLSLTNVPYGYNGYQYRCVVNGGTATSTPAALTVNNIVPGAPTLTGADPGNNQITLSWTAPADNGGSVITGYQYSTDNGGNWKALTGTLTQTITVTSETGSNPLVNGISYNCSVRAVNAVGNGTASAVMAATPRTVPGAPVSLNAAPGNEKVTLDWITPNNYGSAITGYQLSYGETATYITPSWNTISGSGAGTVSHTVTGLTPGTDYTFEIRTVNAAGNSASSGTVTATPTASPPSSGGGSSTPANPSGSFAGGNSVYTRGSGLDLVYTVNKDFSQFNDIVKVDDKALASGTDYKAESSSTKITLFAGYLDTLALGEHTLTVSFKDKTVATAKFTAEEGQGWINPFTDVNGSDWYFGDVAYVHEKGLMSGTSETLFSPNMPLTRAMIVTMLWRHEGSPDERIPAAAGGGQFTDVSEDAYYYQAVNWAAANSIVSGYDGRFSPENNITRQDLAAILWRYAQHAGIDVSVGGDTNILSYNDVSDVSEYAIPAMQWACGADVISGRPGGLLDPLGTATRAEAAAMLHRFIAATED